MVVVLVGCEIEMQPIDTAPPGRAPLQAAKKDQATEADPTRMKSDRAEPPRGGKQSAKDKDKLPPGDDPWGGIGVVGSLTMSFDEGKALDRIGAEIRDALELRKTLVVWLIEQSPAAEALWRGVSRPIVGLMHELAASSSDRLEMAAVAFGSEATFLTTKPTANAAEFESAVANIGQGNNGNVAAFAALDQAVEKFLPRRWQGYEVIFVVVGASSGDDLDRADDAAAALKRAAAPVFGIGPAAPFGISVERAARGRMRDHSQGGNSPSESLFPERIPLTLPGSQGTADLTDSGYGPFGLERLCRQTEGKFLRLHDSGYTGWEVDPATGEVKPELLRKYTPDYVNEEQYRQLLAENKCRLALHQAAQLPPTAGLENERTDFPQLANEAAMARSIEIEQRKAAVAEQPVHQLYQALAAGESDRPNLTGARWQAGYDLAMGQALAAKARLDGYNAMLATLKQGKKFSNPNSKRWVLEPADEVAAASVLDKMAKNSRVYLKRVVEEHKGTPWAAVAERELRHPAGWRFVEK